MEGVIWFMKLDACFQLSNTGTLYRLVSLKVCGKRYISGNVKTPTAITAMHIRGSEFYSTSGTRLILDWEINKGELSIVKPLLINAGHQTMTTHNPALEQYSASLHFLKLSPDLFQQTFLSNHINTCVCHGLCSHQCLGM